MESDPEVDTVQDFADTVKENGYFSAVYARYNSPELFCKRNEKIYARSMTLDAGAQSVWLKFDTDIDGCVVELNDIRGVHFPVRHITVCPGDSISVRDVSSLLKKHVRLYEYSKSALCNFNRSVGFQLFYEHGWECWIALIPTHEAHQTELKKDVIRQQSFNAFQAFRLRLQHTLESYVLNGVACRTLMKNDLNCIRKLFILPDDSASILAAVQQAISGLEMRYFRPIVFCFRFGEKMRTGLSLSEFAKESVKKVTVHAAVNCSSVCSVDLMWSMSGLQDLVGDRGTLGTCLSFSDCATFQSNLDGRLIDISPELRSVCRSPQNVLFVQLYADLPHMKPKTRFHPVSGSIIGGMRFAKPTSDAFHRDAQRYLSCLKSNWNLMRRSECRLEFVTELDVIPDIVKANECLDLVNFGQVLEEKSLLVPLPSTTLHNIRHLGLWLNKELEMQLDKFHSTGNIGATWYAYQLELASEKLLWGRQLCGRSYQLSINLGPGVLQPSRSLTDELGFLALDRCTACMSTEDSIPPYNLWTLSEIVGKRIQRAAGLHDHLEGSFAVIGRRLMHALLQDFFEVGDVGKHVFRDEFMREMRSGKTRFKIVAAVTPAQLTQLLAMKRRTHVHMVFDVLCEQVRKSGVPLDEVLAAGIRELQLTYFPAVDTRDDHRNAVLTWTFAKNFWAIRGTADEESTPTQIYSDLVRGELERRGLIFPSKLKKTPAEFPWIPCCVEKLKREKLSVESTTTLLAFISCIALNMQGWYIDFECLVKLMGELPLPQHKLIALEIQSKLEIPNFKFKQVRLYRLHHSIPQKFAARNEESTVRRSRDDITESKPQEATDTSSCNNRISENTDGDVTKVVRRETSCRPINQLTERNWSTTELEILHEVSNDRAGKTVRMLYETFKEKCLSQQVPFRTFSAFATKLKRIG